MNPKLDFYLVDLKYIRSLSKIDDNVLSISPQRGKQNRPFVGIITVVNGRGYCVPLTSPKDKFKNRKSQIDFIKIFDPDNKENDGNPKLIGVLNINNMIPVTSDVIKKIDLTINQSDDLQTRSYKHLQQKQLNWCRKNVNVIENRVNKVYDLVVNHPEKNRNLTKRTSKLKKLEEILDAIKKKL